MEEGKKKGKKSEERKEEWKKDRRKVKEGKKSGREFNYNSIDNIAELCQCTGFLFLFFLM